MNTKWQVVEGAIYKKRIKLLPVRQVYYSRSLNTYFANPSPTDMIEFDIVERYVILHNKEWIAIRSSFYQSKEWKDFRRQLILDRGKCERCDSQDHLQVHHKAGFELDATVLNGGFLEALDHPERFEVVCQNCHYKEHKPLIEAEQRLVNKLEVSMR